MWPALMRPYSCAILAGLYASLFDVNGSSDPIQEVVDGWDEEHAAAWQKLYRLISDVMREGAESRLFTN